MHVRNINGKSKFINVFLETLLKVVITVSARLHQEFHVQLWSSLSEANELSLEDAQGGIIMSLGERRSSLMESNNN